MNSLTKRKLQERFKAARPIVLATMQSGKKSKSVFSSLLRRVPVLRDALHLPSNRVYNWQEWAGDPKNPDFETPLDDEYSVVKELPKTNEEQVYWVYAQGQSKKIQRTFVATLHNAYAWGYNGGCYFTQQGDLLWDLGKEHWTNFGVFYSKTRLKFPKPTHYAGTVAVLAHGQAYSNYAHWLFDVTPKFGLLERAGLTPDKIDYYAIGYKALPFQLETLDRAGIPREKVIAFEPETYLQAETLIVPFLSTYSYMVHQESTLQYIRTLFGVGSDSPLGTRRLFISRSDASFRHLNQEEELKPALEAMGFEIIALGGMGIADTAQLFREAAIVAGPFGSGLMNIVFCAPGAKMIEIVGPTFLNCFHWYLSEASGMDHYYFMGNGKAVPEGGLLVDLTKDIDVDSEKLVSFLSDVVAGKL